MKTTVQQLFIIDPSPTNLLFLNHPEEKHLLHQKTNTLIVFSCQEVPQRQNIEETIQLLIENENSTFIAKKGRKYLDTSIEDRSIQKQYLTFKHDHKAVEKK